MADKNPFYKQYSVAVPLLLIVTLGPLAALSIGSKVANEETLARAKAGLENYQPPDLFENYEPPEATSGSTVMDITDDAALFDTFQHVIESTGMDERLSGQGPYTLFVPLDSAFERMPAERLRELMGNEREMSRFLKRHIVPGRIGMTDLMQMDQVQTLDGRTVALDSGPGPGLHYGGAEIVKGNLAAGNGLVHVIDRVVM